MVIYDINTYIKDEDVTEITYKLYNQDEESVYPEITICVDSPWRDDQLHAYGDGVNNTTYENYLRGRSFNKHMIDIDFDKISIDITEYLIDACLKNSFQGDCVKFEPKISLFFEPGFLVKCFSIHNPPGVNIVYIESRLNTSVFPNSIRPEKWGFIVRFPLSNQNLRSAKITYGEWKSRQNMSNGYTMNFYVRNVQIIKRRNKKVKPCYQWNKYDYLIVQDLSKKVSCKPVYWHNLSEQPICTSKEDLKYFEESFYKRYFGSEDTATYIPPCIEIADMQIEYDDIEPIEKKKVDEYDIDGEGVMSKSSDWFKVRLWFRTNDFIEIKQIKAYEIQSLIGNTAGVIGIYLGVGLIHFPYIIINIYSRIINLINKK